MTKMDGTPTVRIPLSIDSPIVSFNQVLNVGRGNFTCSCPSTAAQIDFASSELKVARKTLSLGGVLRSSAITSAYGTYQIFSHITRQKRRN